MLFLLSKRKVSGSRYEDFFMPCAAGVGYSYSHYRCFEEIDLEAGMLRLVMGLGTGAVDRIQGSYPCLVNLDCPRMTTAVTSREKHQFSQRRIDVIDTVKRVLEHLFSDNEKLWKHKMYFAWRLSSVYYNENFD